MIKVIVADDHPVVRVGLKSIFAECDGIVLVGEVVNGPEILKIDKKKYDIILLEIAMPGRNGLEIIKDLKIENPNVLILVFTFYQEDQYALRALKAGASGYLMKKSTPDQLIMAIKTVANRGKYVSQFVVEQLTCEVQYGWNKAPQENLSDREYQIMCMISSGRTLSIIAEELCLSVKTISTYRARILKKMGMKTNAEITYYAIKHGLVG